MNIFNYYEIAVVCGRTGPQPTSWRERLRRQFKFSSLSRYVERRRDYKFLTTERQPSISSTQPEAQNARVRELESSILAARRAQWEADSYRRQNCHG